MAPRSRCEKCQPVLFRHIDGWDIYPAGECHEVNGRQVPAWFDAWIVEGAATKEQAWVEFDRRHPLGICLV